MKFKKLRVLALAMSVAVAASAVPSAAFAEDFTSGDAAPVVEEAPEVVEEFFDDAEVIDTTDVAVQQHSDAYQVDPETIDWDFDEDAALKIDKDKQSVEVKWTEKPVPEAEGAPYDMQKTVTDILKISDPGFDPFTGEIDCEAPGYVWFTTVIDGNVYNSGDPHDLTRAFVWRLAPGHKFEEVRRKIIDVPSCLGKNLDNTPSDTDDTGVAHVWEKCSVCGEERERDVELEAPDHQFGPEQFRYTNLNNIDTTTGTPMLIDVTKDGTYTIEYYQVCAKCRVEKPIRSEDKEIMAQKGVYAKVTDEVNIAEINSITGEKNSLIGLKYSEECEIPPANEIELKNCLLPGYYEVTFYSGEDKPISHDWIEVPAHHMFKDVQVEFLPNQDDPTTAFDESTESDDAKQCTVVYNADRTDFTIVNNHCTDPVTYYKVVHCYAKDCPNPACDTVAQKYIPANGEDHYTKHEISREELVVQATGDHQINTKIHHKVEDLQKQQPVEYAEILKACEDDQVYVKVTKDNATCTEPGSVTVSFICKLCTKVIDELVVTTKPLGHIWTQGKAEEDADGNRIGEDPTCEKEGWYNAVIYCGREGCGVELARRDHVRIPRLFHSNETGIDQDGHGEDISRDDDVNNINNNIPEFEWKGYVVVDLNGSLITNPSAAQYATVVQTISGTQEYTGSGDKVLTVTVTPVTLCNLGCQPPHRVELTDNKTSVSVVSVTPQGPECKPGSITLRATYDNGKAGAERVVKTEDATFKYYTSLETYRARVDHDPDKPVIENEVPATADKAGSYDEVVYCKVCGTELSRETKTTKHEHVEGDPVEENYQDATCTEAGSYDEVVYCTSCDDELSREKKVIPAKGHQWGEFEEKERVDATALKDGYVKYVKTCEVCGETEEKTDTLPATRDYTVPGKVTGIDTTANEAKQKIAVYYNPTKDAEKYRIYWKEHSASSYQKKDTASQSYTISGLTPNALYDIRVRAGKTVDGQTVWGANSGVKRRWLKTVQTSYTKTANSITVDITPVAGADQYQIRYSEYRDMTDEKVINVKASTTSYKIKGLEAGTKYYIRVRPVQYADGKKYLGALNKVKGVTTKKR